MIVRSGLIPFYHFSVFIMQNFIKKLTDEHTIFFPDFLNTNALSLAAAAQSIANVFLKGGKLYLCGSGISCFIADYAAQQFFTPSRMERPPFPAYAFNSRLAFDKYDTTDIYERQVNSFCSQSDILWGIAAGDGAEPVVKALRTAARAGMDTIGLCGRKDIFKGICDTIITAASDDYADIQSAHIFAIHTVCTMVEKIIFEPGTNFSTTDDTHA